MRRQWISEFLRLAGWLSVALLLGVWIGEPAVVLLVALAIYLALVLRQLYRLDKFLTEHRGSAESKPSGLWSGIFSRADGVVSSARRYKRQYRRLLTEVNESTGSLEDGVAILNSKHEIIWLNPAASRLLALDPASDIGQRLDNLVRSPDLVRELADSGGDTITILAPQDQARQLSLRIISYGDRQSLAIVRDVTHQMKLERMRRDFVANASHELRSPLTVISGYLDALADADDLPASWKVPIGETQRQAERMTRILSDLLELMRLESAEGRAEASPVDVCAMLELIEKEFAARTEFPRLNLDLDAGLSLLGSESELHSVFYNLINNAVRFTPPDGKVRVCWEVENDTAIFVVEDTGIGIPEEDLPRITERFYRVDRGRSRDTGGTGLGLAIVKHALQRHDSTLAIKSRIGQGSMFRCQFPDSRVVRSGDSARVIV